MKLAEVFEFISGEEAQLRQHAVVAGGSVALAQDEAVAVGVLGIPGVHPHLRAERGAHHLHCGE
ncbi:hypothetical protein SDC9_120733 [bioreactor metagenome]|uniref:Uncharacterized protein n=1 Tax=bioreactor metagenome TaxID=1076179 RepID=A0A645C9Z6_9ZZZZ